MENIVAGPSVATHVDDGEIAYADCFAGISGDMFLAAMLDAGLPAEILRGELAKLALDGYDLKIRQEAPDDIKATRLEVVVKEGKQIRTWRDIRQLIRHSRLDTRIQETSLGIFTLLAAAEAKIHDCDPADVHFHEIGGVDSIIDIVGAAIGLTHLGIGSLFSSPLPISRGWVECAHGRLPLPAPAVCEILAGAEVFGVDTDQELVTPTGAAILKYLSRGFGSFPKMIIKKVGYGAGSRQLADRPNLFRLVIGKAADKSEAQEVEVIETSLDDWVPEGFPHLLERLFAGGALDVTLTPIHMKKGRPGFLLQVLAEPARSLVLKNLIFTETSTIGLRYRTEKRMTLPRTIGSVPTIWGPVAVKKVETPDGPVLYPEYESCRATAQKNKISLQAVYTAVRCQPPENFTEDLE
jgi:uncharacterized protein (TIGR00299 family) protein